jgi:hypothetical protein
MREHGHGFTFDEAQACFDQCALAALARGHLRQRRAMDGRDFRPAMTVGLGSGRLIQSHREGL